jgi:hypothetical protein
MSHLSTFAKLNCEFGKRCQDPFFLAWNPIRLVQRNGRIDRIGSTHADIGIYNLFPEAELEALLHLIERLTDRISTIDELDLLDGSVLGDCLRRGAWPSRRRLLVV